MGRYPAQSENGRLNIIATYVFWNVHEELLGRFRSQQQFCA